MGVDVKTGLPGGLTLTGTVNPDFGQVEVDPAVVNLSAFETFFPERRPFFVEGADVFRFGHLMHFNSYGDPRSSTRAASAGRRSARVSRPPSATFVDAPEHSTILGAAKVTGRLRADGRSGCWTP